MTGMTPEQRDRYIALARTIELPDPDTELAVGWKLTHVDGTTRNRSHQWRVVLPGDEPVLHVATQWQDDNDGSCPSKPGDGLCFAGAGEAGEFHAVQSGSCRIGAAIGHILVYPTDLARSDRRAKHRAPWVVQVATFDPVHVLAFASLAGADLTGANLTDVNLTDVNLTDVNLTGADLTGAYLTGADLTGAYLTDADLTDADLTDANLTDADLTGANLTGANLTGADLYDADLTDADLTGANLARADLTGVNLARANLTGVNLARADLYDAYLTGANLTRANLTYANLTRANLAGAVYDADYLAALGWVVNSGGIVERVR